MTEVSTTVITPIFRMVYPELLAPVKDLNGRLVNSVTALFPKGTDLSEMKAAAEAAALKKWPKKALWPSLNLRMPFADGNTKGKLDSEGNFKVYKGYEDTTVVNMKRVATTPDGKMKEPLPVVQRNTKISVSDPAEVYGGRWARAQVNFYAYDNAGNRGVAVGLNMVQLLDHDEPLGVARTPEAVFDDDISERSGANPDDFMA